MNTKYLSELLLRAAPADIPPSQHRRTVLRMAADLAASAGLAPIAPRKIWAQPRFNAYPFTLGIASGSLRADLP